MATFLDLGILNYFNSIFPALLIFAVMFALLNKIKILGDKKGINAFVAIIVAFMVLISEDVTRSINLMAPWFILVFIFAILLLTVYMILGAKEEDFSSFIKTDKAIQWFIFAIGLIIVIGSLSQVYGQRFVKGTPEYNETYEDGQISTSTGSFTTNVSNVFFNTKILGVLFIFLVAVFAIALLSREG